MDENVIFDDKKTHDDWGLVLQKVDISLPTPVYKKIEVPGRDGALDLTEWSGRVNYKERDVTILFTGFGDSEKYLALVSTIGSYLQGKKRKMWLPYDPGHYFWGRFEVNVTKTDDYIHEFEISGTADPYRYETYASDNNWEWDAFCFEDGIIREYADLTVNGILDLNIPGTDLTVIPVFAVAADMEMIYNGVNYALTEGDNTIYEIRIGKNGCTVRFKGNGSVTVKYRGGVL